MSQVQELIQDITFEGLDPDRLAFNEELNFLYVQEATLSLRSITIVGFGTPLAPHAGFDMTSKAVRPVVDLSQISEGHRTLDEQEFGVGPRLYNTPLGLSGVKHTPDTIGVYKVLLQRNRVADRREQQGGRLRQAAAHAGRIVQSNLASLDAVVEAVHASYGNAHVAQLKVSARDEVRRKRKRITGPGEGLEQTMMVVRSSYVTLHKVGERPAIV